MPESMICSNFETKLKIFFIHQIEGGGTILHIKIRDFRRYILLLHLILQNISFVSKDGNIMFLRDFENSFNVIFFLDNSHNFH